MHQKLFFIGNEIINSYFLSWYIFIPSKANYLQWALRKSLNNAGKRCNGQTISLYTNAYLSNTNINHINYNKNKLN